MSYYVVDCCCKDKPYLSEIYIVKAVNENSAIDIVMEQRINEINVQHQEANEEYKSLCNDDILFPTFAILFPMFTRDDLIAFNLDEYIEKYGKDNTLDIGG